MESSSLVQSMEFVNILVPVAAIDPMQSRPSGWSDRTLRRGRYAESEDRVDDICYNKYNEFP